MTDSPGERERMFLRPGGGIILLIMCLLRVIKSFSVTTAYVFLIKTRSIYLFENVFYIVIYKIINLINRNKLLLKVLFLVFIINGIPTSEQFSKSQISPLRWSSYCFGIRDVICSSVSLEIARCATCGTRAVV